MSLNAPPRWAEHEAGPERHSDQPQPAHSPPAVRQRRGGPRSGRTSAFDEHFGVRHAVPRARSCAGPTASRAWPRDASKRSADGPFPALDPWTALRSGVVVKSELARKRDLTATWPAPEPEVFEPHVDGHWYAVAALPKISVPAADAPAGLEPRFCARVTPPGSTIVPIRYVYELLVLLKQIAVSAAGP
jgi:hypothetical protein